ncbi:hypothetical protein K4K60_000064 [Colletotrichum sp. SAR11_57]|nr:hypothetical protein K4K60_000064 [Colletotrichum sp. SAR11_57]
MPPRRSIRDEDWERLRLTIQKLYLEEDRSLKDVLLILGTFHSFYPSKAQLEWRLKQWHFTKNMGVLDWKYCYETAIEKAMCHVPEPPMPEDQPLLVCTPAPEEMNWPCRVDNIPWLLSRKLIEGNYLQNHPVI